MTLTTVMQKLPNPEQVITDIDKLAGYYMNMEHQIRFSERNNL
jgi:hypothetical protein